MVIATAAFQSGDAVWHEAPLPLEVFAPGHCFQCAACLLQKAADGTLSANADGWCAVLPGVIRCQHCQRIFCSTACQASEQHGSECGVMKLIDNPAADDDACRGTPEGVARRNVVWGCEAVCRVALLPQHNVELAAQVALLDSSYPRSPFGESCEAMQLAFSRLASRFRSLAPGMKATAVVEQLWHIYGLIHTNADIFDVPTQPGQPKLPVICRLLRPRIAFLAHACRPNCYLEIDFHRDASAKATLRVYCDVPPSTELTRCYAGSSRESAARFTALRRKERLEVLREKGFNFECKCELCVSQVAASGGYDYD